MPPLYVEETKVGPHVADLAFHRDEARLKGRKQSTPDGCNGCDQ